VGATGLWRGAHTDAPGRGHALCRFVSETRLPSCYSLRLPSVFLMCSVHCVLLGLDLDGGLARGCCADSVAIGGLNPWLLLGWQLAAGSWELDAGCCGCCHCHCDCGCRHRCCCGCSHCRCCSGLLWGMKEQVGQRASQWDGSQAGTVSSPQVGLGGVSPYPRSGHGCRGSQAAACQAWPSLCG